MTELIKKLAIKLNHAGITILEINLYDLCIDLLKKRNIWEKIRVNEPSLSKNELKELLQGVLDIEKHVIPAIAEIMKQQKFHVMFLTGVGEVFPYIRSHNVLNILQSTATKQPTVMFFPGAYTHSSEKGASLNLFGRLQDDKYYRAFNIYDFNV